jgi:hypothetical protein
MTEKRTISRSEEIRQRRTQKGTKRQRTASERAYRPLPPVTSRDVSIFGVETATRRKPAARRYHSAIGMPREQGWRRLLPMLPDVQTGPRLISFILVLLLGAAIYFFAASPEFRVAEPQINGLVRLTPAEVNSMLGLGGQLIFTLRPEDVAARVRTTFPELASAGVQIALPNKVVITVQERQPVLLWQQGNGFTWIDDGGVAFRPHGEAQGLISVVALASPPGAAAADQFSPAGTSSSAPNPRICRSSCVSTNPSWTRSPRRAHTLCTSASSTPMHLTTGWNSNGRDPRRNRRRHYQGLYAGRACGG